MEFIAWLAGSIMFVAFYLTFLSQEEQDVGTCNRSWDVHILYVLP